MGGGIGGTQVQGGLILSGGELRQVCPDGILGGVNVGVERRRGRSMGGQRHRDRGGVRRKRQEAEGEQKRCEACHGGSVPEARTPWPPIMGNQTRLAPWLLLADFFLTPHPPRVTMPL